MAVSKNNPVTIASLLAVAALLCLGLSLRLLAASGEVLIPLDPAVDTRLASILTIGGGLLIFLIGTVSLLVARRYALSTGRKPVREPKDLEMIDIRHDIQPDIQRWSAELEDIRDELRRDVVDTPSSLDVEHLQLTIPASFQPEGQYMLSDEGRLDGPLADLTRTRDQLMEAAERVDVIMQSIHGSSSSDDPTTSSSPRKRKWLFWRESH